MAGSVGELLGAGSDLVRRFDGASRVDLLLLSDDGVPARHRPTAVAPGPGASSLDPSAPASGLQDGADGDEADPGPGLRAAAAELGLPNLYLHRLGLRTPVRPQDEDDVVAAISELVGFDPEPGVYCVVPAGATDPEQSVVDRAVGRIAAVYRLSMLTYLPVSAGDRDASALQDDPPLGFGQAAPYAERFPGL